MNVLLVEDDESQRLLYRMLLEAEGFTATARPSSDSATDDDIADADVIVLDWCLGDTLGSDLLERSGDTPVVIVTAHQVDYIAEQVPDGVPVLSKAGGINIDEFVAVLRGSR